MTRRFNIPLYVVLLAVALLGLFAYAAIGQHYNIEFAITLTK
jgi:hypothetical protein